MNITVWPIVSLGAICFVSEFDACNEKSRKIDMATRSILIKEYAVIINMNFVHNFQRCLQLEFKSPLNNGLCQHSFRQSFSGNINKLNVKQNTNVFCRQVR